MAFSSEKLNEAKQKYSSYDPEMYALVQDLKRWRYYLLPNEFVVYTDNQTLSFLNRQEKLSHRHMKWMEYLQAYTFTIKHKRGISNKVADALSRRNLIVSQIQLESMELKHSKTCMQQIKILVTSTRYVWSLVRYTMLIFLIS